MLKLAYSNMYTHDLPDIPSSPWSKGFKHIHYSRQTPCARVNNTVIDYFAIL